MTTTHVLALFVLWSVASRVHVALAQTPGVAVDRVIQRSLPLPRSVRRTLATGTRDSTGRPGRNYWQLRVDYDIDAHLDPVTTRISGHELAAIHNNSNAAMDVIVLRLDQNIYAPNAARAQPVPTVTDGMTVTRLLLNGDVVDLKPPQGALPRTLAVFNLATTSAAIRLPKPIRAGATATLEVDWSFAVPRIDRGRGLRMGAWGDSLYQVAQWYPRVAVFDDRRDGGWDREPYLGAAEFYNNFGRFDVRIDVPAGWTVGATGVLQNPQDVLTPSARDRLAQALQSDSMQTIVGSGESDRQTSATQGERRHWHFVADSVNDFAWAASDRYVWSATRAMIPGRGFVPVNALYLPGDSSRYRDAGPVVRHALVFYSTLLMPYAFPQLTIADGPDDGMEYPMFVMSSVDAADHEVGHQWWPMMVGTNETQYAFMDEGFNDFMNTFSKQDRQQLPLTQDNVGARYGQVAGDGFEPPLTWSSNYAGSLYGFQAYEKAPMMLSMLGGIVGDTAVVRAMKAYAAAWRFKHPSPWDFAFFMSNALRDRAPDLGWFWYYWMYATESVDGSIQRVTHDDAHTIVTVRQDGAMPSPVVLKVEFAPAGAAIRAMRNSRMIDSAAAIVTWPTSIWFGGSRTFNAVLTFGARRILKVTLDPFGRFPDNDVADNVWPRNSEQAVGPPSMP